jgi:hypothetical protein
MTQPPPNGPPWSTPPGPVPPDSVPPGSVPPGSVPPGPAPTPPWAAAPAPAWGPSPWGAPPPGSWLPPQPAPTNSGSAVAALVLGIVSFVLFCVGPITCVIAIALGHNALSTIEASQGRLGGGGMARAGLILGWIFLGLMTVAALVMLIVLLNGGSVSGGASTSL